MKKLISIFLLCAGLCRAQQSVTVQNNGSGTGTFNTPGVTTYIANGTWNFSGATFLPPTSFGVSQIIAGTNITVSPTNGLGVVTVNSATGVSLAGNNTWTGTNTFNNTVSMGSGKLFELDPGSAAAPGLSFTGATTDGMYHTAGLLGFTIAGSTIGNMTATGLNNMPIGATTPAPVAATTLGATNAVTETGTTQSSSTTTGNVINSGGEGIAKNLNVGGTLAVTSTSTLTGNVGIGQAPSTQALAIAGAANNYAITVVSGNTSGQDYGVNIQAGSTSADFALNIINRAASALFSVRGDGLVSVAGSLTTTGITMGSGTGTVTAASGVFSVTSDKRAKNPHGDFTAGLPEILALHPVIYDFKSDKAHLERAGFYTQDVEPIIHQAVFHDSPDGMGSLDDRPIIAALVNGEKELAHHQTPDWIARYLALTALVLAASAHMRKRN